MAGSILAQKKAQSLTTIFHYELYNISSYGVATCWMNVNVKNGARYWIRTSGLQLRRLTLIVSMPALANTHSGAKYMLFHFYDGSLAFATG